MPIPIRFRKGVEISSQAMQYTGDNLKGIRDWIRRIYPNSFVCQDLEGCAVIIIDKSLKLYAHPSEYIIITPLLDSIFAFPGDLFEKYFEVEK